MPSLCARAALAAFLLLLSSAAASSRAANCTPGAGLADSMREELEAEEDPPALGLIQGLVGRAHPPTGAGRAAMPALLAAEAPFKGRSPYVGDFAEDLLPGRVAKTLDAAEAGALAGALNATLSRLQGRSERFLASASEHSASLLRKVSARGADAAGALGTLVAAEAGPVRSDFGAVAEAVGSEAPVLAAALRKLGLGAVASKVQEGADGVLGEARRIEGLLDNASALAAALGNATEEAMEPLVVQLGAEVDAGLGATESLDGELLKTLRGALLEAESLGGTPTSAEGASFDGLDEQLQSILVAVTEGLEVLFVSVEEATGTALTSAQEAASKSGARGSPLPLGLLLPLLYLFFGERSPLCRPAP